MMTLIQVWHTKCWDIQQRCKLDIAMVKMLPTATRTWRRRNVRCLRLQYGQESNGPGEKWPTSRPTPAATSNWVFSVMRRITDGTKYRRIVSSSRKHRLSAATYKVKMLGLLCGKLLLPSMMKTSFRSSQSRTSPNHQSVVTVLLLIVIEQMSRLYDSSN